MQTTSPAPRTRGRSLTQHDPCRRPIRVVKKIPSGSASCRAQHNFGPSIFFELSHVFSHRRAACMTMILLILCVRESTVRCLIAQSFPAYFSHKFVCNAADCFHGMHICLCKILCCLCSTFPILSAPERPLHRTSAGACSSAAIGYISRAAKVVEAPTLRPSLMTSRLAPTANKVRLSLPLLRLFR